MPFSNYGIKGLSNRDNKRYSLYKTSEDKDCQTFELTKHVELKYVNHMVNVTLIDSILLNTI